MKVLFIHPQSDIGYPLQIGALAAFLKRGGHECRLLDLYVERWLEKDHFKEVKKTLQEFRPDLIAFSCYETSYRLILEVARYLKKHWQIPIIIGGYYPTLAPEEIIKEKVFDYLCRGEGEYPLLELLQALKKGKSSKNIKNLYVKEGRKIYRNPLRPLIEDLNSLPPPDREIIDYQAQLNLEEAGHRNMKVMASRGCPFNCAYCSNRFFRSLVPNPKKYVRTRSVENLLQEMKQLKQKYQFDYFGFHDDNLTLSPQWLKEFTRIYKKEIRMPFYAAARIETLSDETLKMLKNAGCFQILVGVESGDEDYRKKYMKRFMSNKQLLDGFRRARKWGLQTWSYNMVGLPYETRKMMWKTIWLNLRLKPDFAMTSIFYPFKGTELGDLCYRMGWVNLKKKKRVISYATESILDHPNLTHFEMKLAKWVNVFIPTLSFSPFFFSRAKTRLKQTLGQIFRKSRY